MYKIKPCLTLLVVFALFSTPVMASQQAELYLWKFDEFFHGACGRCGDLISLKEGETKSDMSDHPLYFQTGHYSIVLKGSAATTISFFGACNFSTKQGFLIVTKQDNETVFIDDLEIFTPDTWVEVEAKEEVSGAYSAFYHHYPQFENNIRSVNWGRWWSDSLLTEGH